jgi:hypothetical protein
VVAKYRLSDIQAAARAGNLELDHARAWEPVSVHFDTHLDCLKFIADVILELEPADFLQTVSLPNPPHAGAYDEYGPVISARLRDQHEVTESEWYLKLVEGQLEDGVFLVSFHPAERPLRRGGRP